MIHKYSRIVLKLLETQSNQFMECIVLLFLNFAKVLNWVILSVLKHNWMFENILWIQQIQQFSTVFSGRKNKITLRSDSTKLNPKRVILGFACQTAPWPNTTTSGLFTKARAWPCWGACRHIYLATLHRSAVICCELNRMLIYILSTHRAKR